MEEDGVGTRFSATREVGAVSETKGLNEKTYKTDQDLNLLRNLTDQPPPRQPAGKNVNVVDVVVVVEVRRRESKKRVVHRHTKYTNRNPKITADNP